MDCCPPCITGLKIVNSNQPVPLKSIDINAGIKGFVANVTAVLVYKNPQENPIEVIYKFPMDDSSAVYRFEAEVDGKTIIAECQEKQQAKEAYKDALEGGHMAAFMEESDAIADIFAMKVGNVVAGGVVKITFGYVTELKQLASGGVTQFNLYTLLNPRYNPDPAAGTGGLTSPPRVPYVEGKKSPYEFSFRAQVNNSTPISEITSAKDELKVEYNTDKTQANVTLSKPFAPDHDLSLDITYTDPFKPHVILEKGIGTEEGILKEDVLMLNFFPELKDSDYTSNHEFVIIIDRSGSMQGSRIKSAQETLLLFLKSLPMGCYFNIIGFGSHFDKLFPEGSKANSEESMKAAMDYQEKLNANFGGTEILQPLADLYSKPAMETHSRQLFILTDGEVYNTNEIISLVRKNANNTRVFTFGIGEGASTALVKGLARAGRGRAEFIKEGQRMQPIVMKTLKAAMQVGITNLELEWQLGGSPKLLQVPKELPPLFSGDRLIVYAVSHGQAVLDGKVGLRGKVGQRPMDFKLDINAGQMKVSEEGTLPIHRLAAKVQIQQLQDEEKENVDENKAAVILLSTASNIVSHHTAMVAIDKEKSAKLTGKRTVHEVPHMMDPTLQFSGGGRMMCSSQGVGGPKLKMKKMKCSAPVQLRDCSKFQFLSAKRLDGGGAPVPGAGVYSFDSFSSWPLAAESSQAQSHLASYGGNVETKEVQAEEVLGYMAIIQLQTFSGSWKIDDQLEKLVGVSKQKLMAAKPDKISDVVWGTVLALALLASKYSDSREEWEMIEMKAQQWINSQDLHNHTLSALIQLATNAISAP